MGDDLGPGLGQPLVGAGLLRVPVRIDQGMDALGIRLFQHGADEVAGAFFQAAVEEQNALGTVHGNAICPCAGEYH